ncbi:hypothetical protein KCP75_21320 [Salmonella enterica subsp. enterica]|nr:hypothetical protein KCP75_21320 [Salmonella enterica subsp. enterica]
MVEKSPSGDGLKVSTATRNFPDAFHAAVVLAAFAYPSHIAIMLTGMCSVAALQQRRFVRFLIYD